MEFAAHSNRSRNEAGLLSGNRSPTTSAWASAWNAFQLINFRRGVKATCQFKLLPSFQSFISHFIMIFQHFYVSADFNTKHGWFSNVFEFKIFKGRNISNSIALVWRKFTHTVHRLTSANWSQNASKNFYDTTNMKLHNNRKFGRVIFHFLKDKLCEMSGNRNKSNFINI